MTEQLPLQRLAHWVATCPDRVWLRQPIKGQWHDLTWRQVDDQARRLASALLAQGCAPGDRVALLSKNCAEWFISDLAIMMAGLVSVPLYPLQSAESIAYVLEHAQCRVILLGKLDDADKLEAGIGPQLTRIALPYPTLACAHEWHSLLARHAPRAAHGVFRRATAVDALSARGAGETAPGQAGAAAAYPAARPPGGAQDSPRPGPGAGTHHYLP